MNYCPNCKQPWQSAALNTCVYCGFTLPQNQNFQQLAAPVETHVVAPPSPVAQPPVWQFPAMQPPVSTHPAQQPSGTTGGFTAQPQQYPVGQPPIPVASAPASHNFVAPQAPQEILQRPAHTGPVPPLQPQQNWQQEHTAPPVQSYPVQSAPRQPAQKDVPPAPVQNLFSEVPPPPSQNTWETQENPNFVQTYKPAAGQSTQSLFEDSPPRHQGNLFEGEQEYVAPSPSRARSPRGDTAAKASQLQSLLNDDSYEEEYGYEPEPKRAPPKRSRYEDEGYDDAPPPRKNSNKYARDEYDDLPPQRKQPRNTSHDDEYDDEESPQKRGKEKSSNKVLVAIAVVLCVAIVGVLLYTVLYIAGVFDKKPTASMVNVGSGVVSVQSPPPQPSTPSLGGTPSGETGATAKDFASATSVETINQIVSTFYQSYLEAINAQTLDPVRAATEACRKEVAARMEKQGNKDNVFTFTSAEADVQSIKSGENAGRPSIVLNAKFVFEFKPRNNANAANESLTNFQTIELVYENNEWKVNRFILITEEDFHAHKIAV